VTKASENSNRVLIVVLNYNGNEVIEPCLRTIRNNTKISKEDYKLLVVDNDSEDGSVSTAENFADEVIENDRNLGFDIANNIGIEENPGFDYYMLINNDTEVKKGWLRELISTFESNDKAGIVGPKITYPDGEIQSAGFTKNYIETDNIREGVASEDFNDEEEVDAVHGAAIMISREVIDDIGYLDEIYSLGNFEEWDYCNRAKKAGFKVFVNGESRVIHKEDKTKEQMDNEIVYLLDAKNQLKGVSINRSRGAIVYSYHIFLKKIAASLIGYKFNPFNSLYRAFKEYIIDLPDIMHKRYNRTEYIPSYYCEDIKDYSKRYEKYT
jgi:GT2 family glycosyltransferase